MKKYILPAALVLITISILIWESGWGHGYAISHQQDSTFYTQRIQEIYDSVNNEPDMVYHNTSLFLKVSLTDTGIYVPLRYKVTSFPYYVTRGRFRMKIYTIPPDSAWRKGWYMGPLPSDSAK